MAGGWIQLLVRLIKGGIGGILELCRAIRAYDLRQRGSNPRGLKRKTKFKCKGFRGSIYLDDRDRKSVV